MPITIEALLEQMLTTHGRTESEIRSLNYFAGEIKKLLPLGSIRMSSTEAEVEEGTYWKDPRTGKLWSEVDIRFDGTNTQGWQCVNVYQVSEEKTITNGDETQLVESISKLQEMYKQLFGGRDTMTYLRAYSKYDTEAGKFFADNSEKLLAALTKGKEYKHGCEGSMELASKHSIVQCSCGCLRSCCAFCGNEVGEVVDTTDLGIEVFYIQGGVNIVAQDWTARYLHVGSSLQVTHRSNTSNSVLTNAPVSLSNLIREILSLLKKMKRND